MPASTDMLSSIRRGLLVLCALLAFAMAAATGAAAQTAEETAAFKR
jgi:hypothetical protein